MLKIKPVFLTLCILSLGCHGRAAVVAKPKPVKVSSLDLALSREAGSHNLRRVRALLRRGANVNAHTKNYDPPLIEATRSGDYFMVRLLLRAGANVNIEDSNGETALVSAVSDMPLNMPLVKLLIDHGAATTGKAGAAALILAARSGNLDAVKLLLAHGANVNAVIERNEQSGETALMGAAYFGSADMVQLLLDKGANVNFQGVMGETALMYAAAEQPTVLRLLLDKGARVNARNKRGETALLLAVNYPNNVRLLLAHGALVNVRDQAGETALIRAAKYGNSEAAQLLLQHQANPNAQGNQGQTALMQAVSVRSDSVVKVLLAHGADVNLTDKSGRTAVTQAVTRINSGVVQALLSGGKLSEPQRASLAKANLSFNLIEAAGAGNVTRVKALLLQDVNVNARDEYGDTALCRAAGQRPRENSQWRQNADYMTVARLLLARGADPKIGTPLLHALRSLPMMQLLVNGGAAVDARNSEGETALMLSVWRGAQAVPAIRFLIEHGANVNAQDNYGQTPFIKTMTGLAGYPNWSSSNPSVVQILRAAGADINKPDKRGYTVLMAAAHSKDIPAVKLLLDNGANINAHDAAGTTALMYACRVFIVPTTAASGSYSRPPDVDTVRLLLSRGAAVNAHDKQGATALMEIAKFEYETLYGPEGYGGKHDGYAIQTWRQAEAVKIATLLLHHGAQVNVQMATGDTALKMAKMRRNGSMMRLLKRAGAKG